MVDGACAELACRSNKAPRWRTNENEEERKGGEVYLPDSRSGEEDLIMRARQLTLLVQLANVRDVGKYPRLDAHLDERRQHSCDQLYFQTAAIS